jgi:hypothetical protein
MKDSYLLQGINHRKIFSSFSGIHLFGEKQISEKATPHLAHKDRYGHPNVRV